MPFRIVLIRPVTALITVFDGSSMTYCPQRSRLHADSLRETDCAATASLEAKGGQLCCAAVRHTSVAALQHCSGGAARHESDGHQSHLQRAVLLLRLPDLDLQGCICVLHL